ncbi:MAG TPA: phospholipase [Thermoanaerobaculia bacterium]|nr:phospholipase [Thermoanaerobaculia bacterium]
MTRRELLSMAFLGLAAARQLSAQNAQNAKKKGDALPSTATEARLVARPGAPMEEAKPGLHELGLGGRRDGVLYVPKGYKADRPAPLAVMLHGAGGSARRALGPFQNLADEAGLILLATDSRGQTWDVLEGGYGPDIAFLDRALEHTFARCAVDPKRIAAEGFSDGASYALSIGITNGDLFSHVIALSPGFMVPKDQRGKPKIYVSHGTGDQVLSIDRCSRKLVPQLKNAGYDVLYREFDGPHTVPPDIAKEAVKWFAG